MANYTDTFRKPAMTDETGIAIAEKLSGDTASEYKVNTSEEFRKAPMSDATAQEILAKIDGGGDDVITVTFTKEDDVISCDKTINEIDSYFKAGKRIVAFCDFEFFGGSYPSLINNGIIQNGTVGTTEIGYVFGNLVLDYSIGGVYYNALYGKIVDDNDVWEITSPIWYNS